MSELQHLPKGGKSFGKAVKRSCRGGDLLREYEEGGMRGGKEGEERVGGWRMGGGGGEGGMGERK